MIFPDSHQNSDRNIVDQLNFFQDPNNKSKLQTAFGGLCSSVPLRPCGDVGAGARGVPRRVCHNRRSVGTGQKNPNGTGCCRSKTTLKVVKMDSGWSKTGVFQVKSV